MTTPHLSTGEAQHLLIAGVPWPTHKALSVLVGVVVLLVALLVTATPQPAFVLATVSGMLAWWIARPLNKTR